MSELHKGVIEYAGHKYWIDYEAVKEELRWLQKKETYIMCFYHISHDEVRRKRSVVREDGRIKECTYGQGSKRETGYWDVLKLCVYKSDKKLNNTWMKAKYAVPIKIGGFDL